VAEHTPAGKRINASPSTSCEDWRRKECTIDSAPGLALVTNGVKYYAISVKTTVFRATQNSPLT
jgi:hypothetical protein